MSIDSSVIIAPPFYTEVGRGLVPGWTSYIIRGHNPSQTAASGDVDISEFGDLTYLTSAETMDIVSSSTSDDGSPAGIGAQTLLITGLDTNLALQSETVTMNGTTIVVTANTYKRILSMQVTAAGSSGWNVGNITADATTSTPAIQDEMDATEGVSQSSHFTIPLNKTGLLFQVELNCAKISGGANPEVEFKGLALPGGLAAGGSWLQLFDKTLDTAVTDEIDIVLPYPTLLPALTDIRMRADTDQNSTESRTRMYLTTIDD